jgi:deoxyribose-phosphate aldolase
MDDVADRIEHTVLGPTTTWEAVRDTLDTAMQYGMRACIPPCYVAQASEYAPGVDVATVVGFPHGQHTPEVNSTEATRAWEDGADELDMVANLGLLGDPAFEAGVSEVVASVPVPVKVIVESHLLAESDLRVACEAVASADAAFVKTSTGFSDGGATVADVAVMSEYLPVKASGGVGSWEAAAAMFDAGAERIGASSGDTIVREYREQA